MNTYISKRFKNIYKQNRIRVLEFISLCYLFIYLINEVTLRKLNLVSEITIVIKGNGTQQILSNYGGRYNYEYKEYELPNQILVNGILQNYIEKYVYNLTYEINKITMKWNNQITNCNSMFEGLGNIISIDLSKFDSSKVTNFDCIFRNCSNIKSINLTNINTSSCLNMARMFDLCYVLETLNLSSFDTSKVTTLLNMFYGCTSLKSLDLSSFYTPQVKYVYNLFGECSSLIFVNLKNFDTYNISDSINMFYGVNSNLIYCANSSKISSILLLSNYTNNCSDYCFTNPKSKIIFDKKKCIDNCYNDNEYKYEYNNICYKSCPNGTHISNINNKTCVDDLYCFNYYNYNHTDCLESVPEGYYLNDSLLKTIDKCDDKCQNCNLESVQNNLCLSCNINNSYLIIVIIQY